MDDTHQNENIQHTQAMRKRFQCDKCDYKSTSKESLTKHIETLHEIQHKNSSKRKVCHICAKRFNKSTTFNTHMQKLH